MRRRDVALIAALGIIAATHGTGACADGSPVFRSNGTVGDDAGSGADGGSTATQPTRPAASPFTFTPNPAIPTDVANGDQIDGRYAISGGQGPYSVSFGPLAPGIQGELIQSFSTLVHLYGQPTSVGQNAAMTFTVTDADGVTGSGSTTAFTVEPPAAQSSITVTPDPALPTDVAYGGNVDGRYDVGGGQAPYTISFGAFDPGVSGALITPFGRNIVEFQGNPSAVGQNAGMSFTLTDSTGASTTYTTAPFTLEPQSGSGGGSAQSADGNGGDGATTTVNCACGGDVTTTSGSGDVVGGTDEGTPYTYSAPPSDGPVTVGPISVVVPFYDVEPDSTVVPQSRSPLGGGKPPYLNVAISPPIGHMRFSPGGDLEELGFTRVGDELAGRKSYSTACTVTGSDSAGTSFSVATTCSETLAPGDGHGTSDDTDYSDATNYYGGPGYGKANR